MAAAPHGKVLRRANPSTIQDKFLVGYQGWFTCPGDGQPLDPHHHGWLHWMNHPIPDGGRPNTDLWPDTSEYSPSELYPAAGLKYKDGEQAYLFSSRNSRTVQRHFHWMALHGVDGAFLQRFAGQCDLEAGNLAIRNQRDEVGDRVREAAEKEGRVFAIMYDVTGVPPDRIQKVIERDWVHLVREKAVLDSPSYLREKGKVVVALWGFGFADTRHHPQTVRNVANYIRNNTPGGAYLIAGVPAHWRTSNSDADPNPDFVNVWLEEFDAISPWTIGRYKTLEEADRFSEEKIKGDLNLIRKKSELFETGRGIRKIDYMPVLFPGGSGFNMTEGKWGWNDIPRRGGNFFWRQLCNVRRQNVRIVYGAMWDEYDEGTAFMPVVQNKRQVPKNEKYNFMALDEDGFDLPPDWYMRICGFAVEGLRGERMIHETFPNKELQDYWSSRPRYEEGVAPSGSSSSVASSGHGYGVGMEKEKEKGDEKEDTWEEWQKKEEEKEKEKADEPPPPPYSLEAELDQAPVQPVVQQTPVSQRPASQPPVAPVPPSQAPAAAQAAIQPNTRASSLNAFAGHNAPSHPATPPANTRPVSSSPAPSSSSRPTSAASHRAPPPMSAASRPACPPTGASPPPSNRPGGSSCGGQGAAPSVSRLADDFSRQTLTASPPRVESLGVHASQVPASCSTGASSGPQVQSSTKPINPFGAPPAAGQPYGPSSFYHQAVPPSQSQFDSPYGTGYNPSGAPYGVPGGSGGFASSMNRQESMSLPPSGPGSSTGTWSQAAWPPPQWGQQQQSQPSYQPYQPKRNQHANNQAIQPSGYQPMYAPGYGQPSGPSLPGGLAPTPSLQSRPSVSGPHGHSAPPLAHSTSNPERTSTLPYLSGPESNTNPDHNSSPTPQVPFGPPQTTSSPPPLQGSPPPPVPSKSSSTYSSGSDVGGFSFPQAHPSMGTQDYYNNTPPQGQGPPYPPHHQGSGYFGQGGVEGAGGGYPPYGSPGPTGFPTPGSEGYGTPGGFAPGPPNFPSPAANYPPPPIQSSYPTYAVGSTSYSSAGFSGFTTRDLSQGFNASASYLSNQMTRATAQGGSLHQLAQSSEKWFGKLKK